MQRIWQQIPKGDHDSSRCNGFGEDGPPSSGILFYRWNGRHHDSHAGVGALSSIDEYFNLSVSISRRPGSSGVSERHHLMPCASQRRGQWIPERQFIIKQSNANGHSLSPTPLLRIALEGNHRGRTADR